MKTINKILVSALVIIFVSCDYLDVSSYFEETGTLEEAFKKRHYAEGFFSNAYEVMYDELADITTGGAGGYSMWASDELLRMDEMCKYYQKGDYSAINLLMEHNKWARVYETIRKSSTFLEYIDLCEELTLNERSEYKAQAHFLRGYAYWILLREYGPVPIMPEYGLDIDLTYEQMAIPRSTFDQCVDFIANEFLIAARNLPNTWPSNNIGRPSRGAALAARARLYLLAASPLFNHDGRELFNLKDNDGQQLIPQDYDESKWARAAAAALDVMNLGQGALYKLHTVPATTATIVPPYNADYSDQNFPEGWKDIDPYRSYATLFDGTYSASKNKEIIFTRPNDRSNGIDNLVYLAMPKTLLGANTVAVTLKQVKAYYRHDGKTVEEAKGSGEYEYDNATNKRTTSANDFPFLPNYVSLKFAHLEPRFYASIAYPGTIWECNSNPSAKRNMQVFYYQGVVDDGNNFSNTESFPITGIGLRKFYNPDDGLTEGGAIVTKFEPAIRYADVLMWYAEALNELEGSYEMTTWQGQPVTVSRDITELHRAIKPVRMRAGLPDFNDLVYGERDVFRDKLKRERQIEFFAECKRYYDLRRWRDAETQENMQVQGFNTNQPQGQWQRFYDEETTYSSSYLKFFNQRMYLWPIPQYELVRNKKLTQNPGW